MLSSSHFTLPKIIGHRGACYYAPENTLSSLRKACELNIPWVEFDVVLTKDEVPVILHDATLDRTTNGSGLIADTSYVDVAALDAGLWFSPAFAGEKIPTFIEYLHEAEKLNLGINVEIKPTPGKEKETATKVVEFLQQHWSHQALPPLVSSFSIVALEQARALDEKLYLALLLDDWTCDWKKLSVKLNCISVHAEHTLLNAHKVQEIKSYVKYVLAYTVDDVTRAQELFAMGVDAVFSNRPDVVQREVVV